MCPKESSQREVSFEYPKRMLSLRNEKNNLLLIRAPIQYLLFQEYKTLKAPIKTGVDDKFGNNFPNFQKK